MGETNNIKAVEMVRQIREMHYNLLKDKSRAERIQFYREQAQKFQAKLLSEQNSQVVL